MLILFKPSLACRVNRCEGLFEDEHHDKAGPGVALEAGNGPDKPSMADTDWLPEQLGEHFGDGGGGSIDEILGQSTKSDKEGGGGAETASLMALVVASAGTSSVLSTHLDARALVKRLLTQPTGLGGGGETSSPVSGRQLLRLRDLATYGWLHDHLLLPKLPSPQGPGGNSDDDLEVTTLRFPADAVRLFLRQTRDTLGRRAAVRLSRPAPMTIGDSSGVDVVEADHCSRVGIMSSLVSLAEQLPVIDRQLLDWEAASTSAAQQVQQALVEAVTAGGGGGGSAVSGEMAVVMQTLEGMVTRRNRWLAASRERLSAVTQVRSRSGLTVGWPLQWIATLMMYGCRVVLETAVLFYVPRLFLLKYFETNFTSPTAWHSYISQISVTVVHFEYSREGAAWMPPRDSPGLPSAPPVRDAFSGCRDLLAQARDSACLVMAV